MQACLESSPKRKSRAKWTEVEQARLKEIVEEIRPEDSSRWRQVCLRMHQFGSRRTQQQYKQRGVNYLPDNQRQQIQLTDELFDQIFMLFDQGTPVETLLHNYANTFQNRTCIKNRITQRFQSLANITRRIGHQKEVRKLAYRDYRFFGFVRREGLQLPSLVEILYHCDRLRLLGRPRNEQEKAEIRQIQLELKRYNELLLNHTQAFTAATQVAKQKNKKRAKACMGQPPTVPYMHLTLAANEISNRHELSQCSESFLAQYHEKRLQTLMTMQTIGDHDERLSDFNGSSFFQDIGEQEEEYQSYWNWQSAAN